MVCFKKLVGRMSREHLEALRCCTILSSIYEVKISQVFVCAKAPKQLLKQVVLRFSLIFFWLTKQANSLRSLTVLESGDKCDSGLTVAKRCRLFLMSLLIILLKYAFLAVPNSIL